MAVGFDLLDPITPGGSFTVEVFGPGGSLGSTVVVGGNVPSGLFFGVDTSDPGGITSMNVTDVVGGEAELYCDLAFGGMPIPVELTGFSVE